MQTSITLSDDARQRAVGSIRRYFSDQLEQELGELPAKLLLEFFLQEIGPCVYNAAVSDAQVYFRERVSDLEGACYAPEFQYWQTTAKPRSRSQSDRHK